MSLPVISPILLEFIIIGLILAMIYSLMATGLTLVYGILRVVNFAYGEIYMIGGYTLYYLTTLLGLPPLACLPVAALAGFALAVVLERTIVRDIHRKSIDRPAEYVMLGTFATTILLQNTAIILFNPFLKTTPPLIEGKLTILTFTISLDRLVAMFVAIVALALLYLFLEKTWIGKTWIAVADNRDGARILGISVEKVGMVSFGVSGALGALAGAVLTPLYGVYPTIGVTPLVIGFVIIVIGGMGSIEGSIVGSIVVGVVQSLVSGLAAPVYGDIAVWILLILFLLFRPHGLLGEKARIA